MSITREDNTAVITFEDDSFKTEVPEILIVTDGSVPFYSANTWQQNGINTLRSGAIGNNGTSESTFHVTLIEDGSVTISYIVSSEAGYDKLHIIVDGAEKVTASGTNMSSFTEYQQALTAGQHTILFRYTKDGSQSRGNDAGAIGYVKLTGVEQPYETHFLMTDMNGKIYTIKDGVVTEVTELKTEDLSKKASYQTYGFDKKPTSEQLVSLTKPTLYRWSEGDLKKMHATIKAVPQSQTISCMADLSHKTITGIAGMTAVYTGNVVVSVSYDGVAFADSVSLADFLKTDPAQMYKSAVNKKIWFRFVLQDKDATLTNFILTYTNT